MKNICLNMWWASLWMQQKLSTKLAGFFFMFYMQGNRLKRTRFHLFWVSYQITDVLLNIQSCPKGATHFTNWYQVACCLWTAFVGHIWPMGFEFVTLDQFSQHLVWAPPIVFSVRISGRSIKYINIMVCKHWVMWDLLVHCCLTQQEIVDTRS